MARPRLQKGTTREELSKTKEWIRCDRCAKTYEEDDGMIKCMLNDLTPMENTNCNNFIEDVGRIVYNNNYFSKR